MILAIESSSLVASVALADEDRVIAEYTTNQKKTHSQTLLPMIEEIFRITDADKKEIDAIAVSAGPGSFTGLRIGSATAKGLGLAWNKPLISVPTVEGLAYNIQFTDRYICPIMDARRNQVYTGIFENTNGRQTTVMEQCAIAVEELVAILNEKGRPVIFLGDGTPVYREVLDEKLSVEHGYAPVNMNRQRASSVAALGMIYYREGRTESSDCHVPNYLRMSQAERERMNRDKKNGA
ncbi:MAG: tRNA (adenosine(37)-N6)-threonylcarbamoyltransferase complex dimerization subunit type 1 TsaB [Lachnospiraceae bacterium]|nr:tRNA (adenosine(37)-N6)-threonylcarbamoyltransferase complex dimerization subunit type 1 TsaB [Lachnospiraceae bacterium]